MNTLHHIRTLPVLLALALHGYFPANTALADFYRIPNTAAGNTYAYEPFALEIAGIPSCRYQQVYGAAAFGTGLPNGGMITSISFNANEVFGARLPDLEIRLSLTPRGPDQLSTTFTDNVGANLVAVFPRGSVFVSNSGLGGHFGIGFTTPYFYNPAAGNLLLEIRNYLQVDPPHVPNFIVSEINAQRTTGDAVSRVFATDVNALTGTADTLGLVTTFAIAPVVPEPSTTVLFLTALAGAALWRYRHKLTISKL